MNIILKSGSFAQGRRLILAGFILMAFTVITASFTSSPASATPVTGFKAGRIIDDAVFTNSTSMNAGQIQAFLNSKVPTCDTWHAPGYGQNPPFICLKDFSENGKSAAQIIYDTAQQYRINPKVFVVLLQKEQGLVTDTWPLDSQYRTATGYGCPDTAPCNSQYYGLTNQLQWSGKMFRSILDNNPNWYTPYILGNNFIRWSPNSSCGGSNVYIENRSTQALYNYTPYQPNQSALNAGYGTGDACGAYGNRNFYLYFTDWFGTTYAYIQNGVSYTDVFNAEYYLNRYPDVQADYGSDPLNAFKHFIDYGMREGRQGSADFDVTSYRNRHQDLRLQFGTNLTAYYIHYITNGKAEGRIATGDFLIQYITAYSGIDYSSVYNFPAYTANHADMQQKFNNDDAGAIRHFVTQGMSEGRQGSNEFNVTSYRSLYYDLRRVLSSNLKAYYFHYITNGKAEGRTGTSNYIGGTDTANSINYSSVYSFNDYETINSDIKNAFGLNDVAALQHFVTYGMSEGWQANTAFNVHAYKARYSDLQVAFGNNLKAYYMHYITNGKAEGRTGI